MQILGSVHLKIALDTYSYIIEKHDEVQACYPKDLESKWIFNFIMLFMNLFGYT